MERGKENGEREDWKANSSSCLLRFGTWGDCPSSYKKTTRPCPVSSAVLREDIVNLRDFIERLKSEEDQTVVDTEQIEKVTFLPACLQLCYYISDGFNAKMSCISYEVHDLVQSLFHQSGDDMLVKLEDHVVPRLLENIKSSKIADHHYESSATMTEGQLVELLGALLVNLHYLPKVRAELLLPSRTQYELLQNVFGNLRDFHGLIVNGCIERQTIKCVLPEFQLMAERVGHFCFVLLSYLKDEKDDEEDKEEAYSMLVHLLLKIIPVSLEVMHICSTNLKASKSAEHMINAINPSTSARNIHVMIEFLLIILADVSKDVIHHDKLFVLLVRIGELTKGVFVLARNLAENLTNEENVKETSSASLNLLEDIDILKKDLKNVFLKVPADSSHLYFPMIVLIKEKIGWVKEHLEHIRSFFGNVEQELHRDLWTRVLDVAYEAEHAINSILARDHGLLQFIFLLHDTIEKIKIVKKEVQEKISKKTSIISANSPNKPVINKLSIAGEIVVGFLEETEWIIRKLTSGPSEIDQEHNEKKLLQKIFNQVIGLKASFNEDGIDNDVADKLRKRMFEKRYLIVLDDLWDTATLDELTRPFPTEFQKGSRVILTSRKKEVALHGKCHSAPLDLRLLRPEESWELLEKRVFGEEPCPDELKHVGEKIAQKCDGLPLVLDLIGGVISRKEKKEALWLEVVNNLSSFIFKDEEEVMKFVQSSYDHLSDHLKPCFLYLASYPKDEDIKISKLKYLWSDEGLVEPTDLKSVEEVTEGLCG
ncbi:hypothetical protein P3S67_031761 [Capsicum chacoense]